jgi:acetyl-CoA synthetase
MANVIDEAKPQIPSLQHVVVVARHPGKPAGKRLWWHDLVAVEATCPAEQIEADAPCMIVYTSGTTGKPKGTVHSHCGFMVKVALDFGIILDLTQRDRLLWMSDMGWLTGPILAVAVPLVGATMVLAEGTPDFTDQGRLWRLAQDHKVTFLGVAPTMIRNFIQQPPEVVKGLFPRSGPPPPPAKVDAEAGSVRDQRHQGARADIELFRRHRDRRRHHLRHDDAPGPAGGCVRRANSGHGRGRRR